MNGKKSKKIRKIIYEDLDYRDREYGLFLRKEIETRKFDSKGKRVVLKKYQSVNTGQMEQIGTKDKPKEISKRRLYQHAKKQMRNIKHKNLKDAILN